MGAEGVVVDPPVLDDPSRLGKRGEDVFVRALVAEPAVGALDEGVSRPAFPARWSATRSRSPR